MKKLALIMICITTCAAAMDIANKNDRKKLRILHQEIGALTQAAESKPPSELPSFLEEEQEYIAELIDRSNYFIDKFPHSPAAQSLRKTRDPMALALQKLLSDG